MNEEQFRSELYRRLVNEIERHKLKLRVKVEERCVIKEAIAHADIVVYDKHDIAVLVMETKLDHSNISQAVTQVYRYGFLFGMPDYGFVAACTPSMLCMYQYDGELGEMAFKTPKDMEGGTYVDKSGKKFSWETESHKRLVEKHEFHEKHVSDIAQKVLDFILREDLDQA